MEKVIQLWSQHQPAFAAAAVVALVLGLLAWRAASRKLGKKLDPQLADDLAKGNYEAAAERELKAGRLHEACDLFLRAQQPMRAAQIAVRDGRLQQAAEWFEKAGSRKRAAELYAQVGMNPKAEELLAEDKRAAHEREAQKAALRKRLEEEPEADDGKIDMTTGVDAPAPAALDVGDLPKGPAPKSETPSLFGIQALVDKAVDKVASQVLAMAATQPSIASGTSAFAPSVASLGAKGAGGKVEVGAISGPVAPEVSPIATSSLSFGSPDAPSSIPDQQAADPSLGEMKPGLQGASFGEVKPAEPRLAFGDHSPTSELPPPIIEEAPHLVPRATRATPRTSIPAIGPSIGAYRMVRPSEPDVFTPSPEPRLTVSRAKTPTPRPSLGSELGEHARPERRTPTPSPRPSLSLGTKRGPGGSSTPLAGVPTVASGNTAKPSTPAPAGRTSPKGTVLGIGPTRSDK